MPSYLDSQLSAFKSSVSSSSTKLANKKTVNTPVRTATPPTSTQLSIKSELKRKRPEQNVTYSQPQDTGTGRNIMTQVTYAIEYLKSKENAQNIDDIMSYLSVPKTDFDVVRRTLPKILCRHEKVEYMPNDSGKDVFRFRPAYNIRSKDTLLAHLQTRHTARGLAVKELKDGWNGVENAIEELELEDNILVTRNKKDQHPRFVWLNDPSLSYEIDEEFQQIFQKTKLPEPKLLAFELEKAGLMPANKKGNAKKVVKQDTKKPKKSRRGGKTTNTHMAGVLRDYSHLKK